MHPCIYENKNVDIRIKGRNKESKLIPMHSFTNPPGSKVLFEDETTLFLCQYVNVAQHPLLRHFKFAIQVEQTKMCWCGQDW